MSTKNLGERLGPGCVYLGLLLGLSLLILFINGNLPVFANGSPHLIARDPRLAEMSICGSVNGAQTWTESTLYIANNCTVVIEAGASVTVMPGAVVKFVGSSSALIVRGALIVQGTAASPAAITSLNDDSHGAIAAGSTGTPQAGDWYGIVFEEGSLGQVNHAFIGFAGAYDWNGIAGLNRAQVDVRNASIELQNTHISTGKSIGIFLEGSDLDSVIQNTQVSDNHEPGGRGYAIYQSTINMQSSYADLSLNGNDRDLVVIQLTDLTQDVVLGGAVYGFACGSTYCPLRVTSGNTLTLHPGVSLDFTNAYGIWIQVLDGGTLLAQGTPTEPVTITQGGVEINLGGSALLSECDISGRMTVGGVNRGLYIKSDDVQVNHCKIHNHIYEGVHIESPTGVNFRVELNQVEITDNGNEGLRLESGIGSSLAILMEGGRISRNGRSGVDPYLLRGPLYLTMRHVMIEDNGQVGGGYAWNERGLNLEDPNIHPVLEDLIISGHPDAAILWNCDGSISAHNLAMTGNGSNTIRMTGCNVGAGRLWDLAHAGVPVHIAGNIDIPVGGLLTIEPGVQLLFEPDRSLWVHGGALYILGTGALPVSLGPVDNTQSPWLGIGIDNGTMVLRHVDLAYAGTFNKSAVVMTGAQLQVIIENSRIHNSGYDALESRVDTPILHYNQIYNNGNRGAIRTWGATPVDARYNWWGDPSGPYHATLNPAGLGDAVGDFVLFEPWLTSPPEEGTVTSELLLSAGAPRQVSPGEMVDYSARYLNLMSTPVESAVLIIQLPEAAHYVDSTHEGIYWPERHQVFWKLGNLAAGSTEQVSARVRFRWGLPVDYTDGSMVFLVGDNYSSAPVGLSASEYNLYHPLPGRHMEPFSQAEFDQLRAIHPDLETLYQEAVSEAYAPIDTARVVYEDGATISGILLATPNKEYIRFIALAGSRSLAMTYGPGLFSMHDTTGGITADLNNLQRSLWGSWLPVVSASTLGFAPCNDGQCLYNCFVKSLGFGMMVGRGTAMAAWAFTGPIGVVIAGGWVIYDTIDTFYTISFKCPSECGADPHNHCCTPGEERWEPNFLGKCARYKCDLAQTWEPRPDITQSCGRGARCVAGFGSAGGCKLCKEADGESLIQYLPESVIPSQSPGSICAVGTKPPCSDLTVRRAKDPNAIYGIDGDLFPGQEVTYKISYENEGEGRAYGVYVTNELPDVFDEGTLDLHGQGLYQPSTRTIFWLVGELGPKGDADSIGEITYTIRLKNGLPSGTVVANQARVFFSSVPEETPTNTWVNVVAPLAAIPQEVSTNYITPVSITLTGREASGLPLTFTLIDPPRGGTLTGTPPDLVYTPSENFTGADGFTFTVSNGIMTSRPAQVLIEVSSAGDQKPPQVVWVEPDDGREDVGVITSPSYTDMQGPVYPPAVLAGFSELVWAETVNGQTVSIENEVGQQVSKSVEFDPVRNQVVIRLRQPLEAGKIYTVTLGPGIADLAGNTAAVFSWRFSTTESTNGSLMIFLPMIKR